MYKRLFSIFMVCGLCMMLAACGPSDEKVQQAQQKYTELTEIHNQVVEAHRNVEDDSLDEALTELREQIAAVEDYNLTEMKDGEIDILIQIMDTLIESYEDFLKTLTDIKGEEDAAILVPIPVTIVNQTDFSFTELKLYEDGDVGIHEDVLAGYLDLAAGETLTGLVALRNSENTPWVLELKDTNGAAYEFYLPVEEYEEEGVKLKLSYDEEQKEVLLGTE